MQEFTATAILAYECGYNEALVRDEVGALGGVTIGKDFQDASPASNPSIVVCVSTC